MYTPQYFKVHEVVPPKVYKERGELALELMDDRALITLDRLRKRYGPITVNNYEFGGDREWSGLRTPDSPFYSKYSQHTFGRAVDCIFSKVTAEEVRQDIIHDKKFTGLSGTSFEFITSMELGTSWLHFDVRNCKALKTYWP